LGVRHPLAQRRNRVSRVFLGKTFLRARRADMKSGQKFERFELFIERGIAHLIQYLYGKIRQPRPD
jgi:hypothetical protein